MTERRVITCDKCNIDFKKNEMYVNAGAYGIHLHKDCFRLMTSLEICIMLDLDDIKIMHDDKWEDAKKITAFRHVRNLF